MGDAPINLCVYDMTESRINQPSHLLESIEKCHKNCVRENHDDVIDLAKSEDVSIVPVTLITFAGPRVGDNAFHNQFHNRFEQLEMNVFPMVNGNGVAPWCRGSSRTFFRNIEVAELLDATLEELQNFIDDLL